MLVWMELGQHLNPPTLPQNGFPRNLRVTGAILNVSPFKTTHEDVQTQYYQREI